MLARVKGSAEGIQTVPSNKVLDKDDNGIPRTHLLKNGRRFPQSRVSKNREKWLVWAMEKQSMVGGC